MRILETELFVYPKNGHLSLDINYSHYIYRDPNIGQEFPDEWFIFLNNQNLPSNNKTASLHWSQIGFEKNKEKIIENYLQAGKYKIYNIPGKILNKYFDRTGDTYHEGTLKNKKQVPIIWQEFADDFYKTVEMATKRNVANSLKRLKIFADALNIENKEAIIAADYIEQNFELNENFGYEVLMEILKRTKKSGKSVKRRS